MANHKEYFLFLDGRIAFWQENSVNTGCIGFHSGVEKPSSFPEY